MIVYFLLTSVQLTNEQGGAFEVDPDNATVKVLKGRSVIDCTNFETVNANQSVERMAADAAALKHTERWTAAIAHLSG